MTGVMAQEAQITRLAGTGLTNSDIAAQSFISSHTVECHFKKVFTELRSTTSAPALRASFQRMAGVDHR